MNSFCPDKDGLCWEIQLSGQLDLLPVLGTIAGPECFIVLEGIDTAKVLKNIVSALPVDFGFTFRRTNNVEDTEFVVFSCEPETLKEILATGESDDIYKYFIHYNILDSSGRWLVVHHDASCGGWPYASPYIPEEKIIALCDQIGCKYQIKREHIGGWEECFYSKAEEAGN